MVLDRDRLQHAGIAENIAGIGGSVVRKIEEYSVVQLKTQIVSRGRTRFDEEAVTKRSAVQSV